MTALQELEEKKSETDFAAALCGLTILRYLTDHITQLPLGLMSRCVHAEDLFRTKRLLAWSLAVLVVCALN